MTQPMVCPDPTGIDDLQGKEDLQLPHRGDSAQNDHIDKISRLINRQIIFLRNPALTQRLDTDQQVYFVVASSNAEKELWIGQIGKHILMQAKLWSSSIPKCRNDSIYIWLFIIYSHHSPTQQPSHQLLPLLIVYLSC